MNGLHRLLGAALAACGVMLLGAPAHAADESPWSQDSRSGVRLLAGANKTGEAPLRAGIEIKLQPGWKTYWRYPGDSGVPPRFDFAGSENLKSAKVLYPAPHLFADESGNSLGYKDAVIFPVLISPVLPGKPVRLRLKLDYAVCEKLCIPAEGRAELTLQAGASSHDAALAAAEARVPKPVSAAAAGLSVRRVNDAAKPLIAIDLKADKPVEIFVEGPTPEWALPIPTPAQGAPADHRHFGFELDGLPPGVDPKGHFELTFTVVEGERAIEVKTHLD
ncbi:MAG: cytochrome C biogenesis protein [Rhizobiales bacterium]|nr:cytochrome C biogenesis protein [Hyphomicrobiales bacterium]